MVIDAHIGDWRDTCHWLRKTRFYRFAPLHITPDDCRHIARPDDDTLHDGRTVTMQTMQLPAVSVRRP
jgi:hypothetical protein